MQKWWLDAAAESADPGQPVWFNSTPVRYKVKKIVVIYGEGLLVLLRASIITS